jgi:hypothetical protein
MRQSARIIFTLGLLALGGCTWLGIGSSSDDDDKKKTDIAKEEKAQAREKEKLARENPPICPQVAILREIDTLRDYGREKPAPDQLIVAAHMTNITGSCSYHYDKDKPQGIDITFELDMDAVRGPRMGGLNASLPFFVAVVDPQGAILNKNRLSAEIKFSSDERSAADAENLHVFIPLAKAAQTTGPDYRVLAGFQLTQEQYDEMAKGKPAE